MILKNLETVRLDRWLMAARFYKTRSQAEKACEGGKVKVNGSSSKPHKILHVGDRITLHVNHRYRNVEVKVLAERGLPPAVARELYMEIESLPLSDEAKELIALHKKSEKYIKPKFKGRPTKKERRDIERFRGW